MADRRSNEPVNNWAELRRTLLVMQENIQVMIHNSIEELAKTILQQQEQRHHSYDEEETEEDENPFAAESSRR